MYWGLPPSPLNQRRELPRRRDHGFGVRLLKRCWRGRKLNYRLVALIFVFALTVAALLTRGAPKAGAASGILRLPGNTWRLPAARTGKEISSRPTAGRKETVADRSEQTNQPRLELVVVAKVGKEAPYIVEWLEFHRAQGVSKFVLYLDDTFDNPDLPALLTLPTYYRQLRESQRGSAKNNSETAAGRGMEEPFLEVRLMSSLLGDATADLMSSDPEDTYALARKSQMSVHRLSQQAMLKTVYEEFKHQTKWFTHFDIDEFVYSSAFKTLTEFLSSLEKPVSSSSPPRSELSTPTSELSNLPDAFQNGEITSLYIHSRAFGLGDSFWFNPRVSLLRNPVSGVVDLYYVPHRPNPTSATSQERLMDMIEQLRDYIATAVHTTESQGLIGFFHRLRGTKRDTDVINEYSVPPPNPLFAAIARNISTSEENLEAIYPLQLELQTRRAGALTDRDTIEIMTETAEIFPECRAALNEVLTKKLEYQPFMDDLVRLAIELRKKGHSSLCAPGAMPSGFTTIGKSFYWTRYRQDQILVGRDGGRRARRRRRQRHISHKEWPMECEVPWVHGCAHRTLMNQQITDSLKLNHHVLRSLESRTIGDVAWRRADNGWGRFQNSVKQLPSFDLLKVTNIKESAGAWLRFGQSLRERFTLLHKPKLCRSFRLLPSLVHPSIGSLDSQWAACAEVYAEN